MELEAERFAETELRDETWDAMTWVYLLGDGIFTADRPRFRAARGAAGVGRGAARGLPAVLDGAKAALQGPGDGRPVGRFQTETALEQLPGSPSSSATPLAEAERAAPDDAAVAALRRRLDDGGRGARGPP